MSKIVYLLGAGASFGKRDENQITPFFDERKVQISVPSILEGVPIVNEIPQRMGYIIRLLKDFRLSTESSFRYDSGSDKKTQQERLDEIISDLEWLRESSSKHATIDTYAKKLYLSGNVSDVYRLKITLSLYLLLEQILNKPDQRYDTLFASIIDDNMWGKIPHEISFMSWNYDSQFELAYSQYSQDIKHPFGVKNIDWYYERIPQKNFNKESSKLIKINGTTALLDSFDDKVGFVRSRPEFNETTVTEIVNNVVSFYNAQKTSNRLKPLLSFAWESIRSEDLEYRKALESNVDAETLIVIGYSFPFFNRKIDKIILHSMKALKRVYIQDPNANNIIKRFNEIDGRGIHVEPITDIEQFFIPYEL